MQEKHLRAPQSYSVHALEANRIINMESKITLYNLIPALCQKMMMRHLATVVLPLCIYLLEEQYIHANHAMLFINMLGHILFNP